MNIYQYSNYRDFLKDWISSQPSKGRGQVGQLAKVLGIHSTIMSLILSDDRELSADHAFILCRHLQLTTNESDYFLLMVQYSRATHHELRKHLKEKIAQAQEASKNLVNRVPHEVKLGPEERAVFYSNWLYSAFRNYSATGKKGVSIEEFAQRFAIHRTKAKEIVDFLVKVQLLHEKDERYTPGTQRTYLERESPLLGKHHSNWRIKALQKFDTLSEQELMFTSPMSLSKSDFAKIKELLSELIKNSFDIVKETDPEDVACLNIDFYWVPPSV